jgi:hypothetical protein
MMTSLIRYKTIVCVAAEEIEAKLEDVLLIFPHVVVWQISDL